MARYVLDEDRLAPLYLTLERTHQVVILLAFGFTGLTDACCILNSHSW